MIRKIKDISLKNQTLYVSVFHTKKQLTYKEKFAELGEARYVGPNRQPGLGIYPCDSREIYYENVADVDGRKGQPTVPPERALWFQTPPQSFDPTDCQANYPRGYISNAFEMAVTSPDYHQEGEDALDKYKEEMDRFMRESYSQMVDGLDDDNVIHHWSATGRDVEFRNTGLIGGTWCGSRHDEDQLWTNRPIPELARYRTPDRGALPRAPDLGTSRRTVPDGHPLQPDAHPDRGRNRRARRLVVRVAVLHPAGRQDLREAPLNPYRYA